MIMAINQFAQDLCDDFEMHAADLAAIYDASLSPAQRRHWDAMEAKQAAREQLQRDAEAKRLQELADSLAEAGRAMDRIDNNGMERTQWHINRGTC